LTVLYERESAPETAERARRPPRQAPARLAALDREEMRQLVLDAWSLAVPKSVAEAYSRDEPPPAPPGGHFR
jgi:hypothetical protein